MKVEDKIALVDLVVELLNSKQVIADMLIRERGKVQSVRMHDGFVLSESEIVLEYGVSYLSKINDDFIALIDTVDKLADRIKV